MYCRKKCSQMLDNLGFKEAYRGTEYVRMGVEMVLANRAASMTKDIYPTLAKATDSTPASVERSMRTALRAAFDSPGWDEEWRRLGGWDYPTNNEVLRRLAREMED